jgi:hypothetical protein
MLQIKASHIISFLLLHFLLANDALAQVKEQFVLIQEAGPALQNASGLQKTAFYGGFRYPRYASIDLNFDGKEDIIALDWLDGYYEVFTAKKSGSELDFDFAPYLKDLLPHLRRFVRCEDFDGDGLKDIFTGNSQGGGVAVYKNVSQQGRLKFELYEDEIIHYDHYRNFTSQLWVGTKDQPAIVDLDNDGDLDILSFDPSGIDITHYINLSQETYGHSDSFNFGIVTECWGRYDEYYYIPDPTDSTDTVEIPSDRLKVRLGGGCSTFKRKPGKHDGSNIIARDFDGDGDFDALITDSYYGNVVYLENGRVQNGKVKLNLDSIISFSDSFPVYNTPVFLHNFPSISEVDYNSDGKLDLLFAPGNEEGYVVLKQNLLYKNVGNSKEQKFELVDSQFIQKSGIEHWTQSQPAFFDYDADGDQDLFITAPTPYLNQRQDTSHYRVFQYENIGDSTNPIFKLVNENFLDLYGLEQFYFSICFGDLDNDGQKDLILGREKGRISFYKNISKKGEKAEFQLMPFKYKNIKV